MRRVLVAAALLLTLTACGSDDGDGVASAGGSKGTDGGSAQEQEQVDDEEARRQFAECMRENGIDMPDPQPGERPMMQLKGDRGKVEAAMKACRKLLPNGGEFQPSAEDLESMRQMAKCMRENGVENFPDPDPNGGGIRIQRGSGIDPDDPEFRAAQEKCREFMPERGPRGGGDR